LGVVEVLVLEVDVCWVVYDVVVVFDGLPFAHSQSAANTPAEVPVKYEKRPLVRSTPP